MKYRLIKLYPGLPSKIKLGYIVHLGKGSIFYAGGSPCVFFPSEHIENKPEFWQKVEEENYKVLSFMLNNKLFVLDEETDCYWSNKGNFAHFLNISDETIVSVKRLSDGAIFSVGGCISYKDSNWSKTKITSFDIEGTHITVQNSAGGSCDIDNLVKVEPLFKTSDGVDVFEGDNVYWVMDNYDGVRLLNYRNIIKLHSSILEHKDSDYRIFKSKTEAERYVKFNKKSLSLKDVFSIYPEFKKHEATERTKHAEELIERVKI